MITDVIASFDCKSCIILNTYECNKYIGMLECNFIKLEDIKNEKVIIITKAKIKKKDIYIMKY